MMQYRNAAYNAHGTIDVEIEIATDTWVPFTASPNDPEEFGRDLYASAVQGEVAAYVAPEPAPLTVADYTSAIISFLDATAQARRYDGAVSISTYVCSTNSDWSAEALAFVAWRDAVWGHAYAELDKVLNGKRAQPTVAELIAELPAMAWSL